MGGEYWPVAVFTEYLSVLLWVQFHKKGRWGGRMIVKLRVFSIFNFLFTHETLIYNWVEFLQAQPLIVVQTCAGITSRQLEELCYKSMEPHQPDELLFLHSVVDMKYYLLLSCKATLKISANYLAAEAFLNNCHLSQVAGSNILARVNQILVPFSALGILFTTSSFMADERIKLYWKLSSIDKQCHINKHRNSTWWHQA